MFCKITKSIVEKSVILYAFMKNVFCKIIGSIKFWYFRFICAFLWLFVLSLFSYVDLVIFMLYDSGHSLSIKILNEEIVNEMRDIKMIFVNIGLIGMAYFDNILSSELANKPNKYYGTFSQGIALFFSILLAMYLTLLSEVAGTSELGFRCEHLPIILFLSYLLCLLYYKMKSLDINHSNGTEY